MELNYLDIGILAFLVIFTLRGAYRGAIQELTGLISVVLGILVARLYAAELAHYLTRYLPEHWTLPAAFILILLAILFLFALIANLLKSVLKALFVGFIDHIFGALAGLAKAFLICGALAYLLAVFLPQWNMVQSSQLIPYLLSSIHWVIGQIPTHTMESLMLGVGI